MRSYKQASSKSHNFFSMTFLYEKENIIFQSANCICICTVLLKTLSLTSGAEKSIFEENVFLTPEVCSFDPGGGGGIPPPDHYLTIIQHENRDFNVFYKKCFFDPADRQPSRQFFFPRLFSTRKGIGVKRTFSQISNFSSFQAI